MIEKLKLIEAIQESLSQQLATFQAAARTAHQAATHEESRAEDSYDTRGLEAAYLASAQAQRAAEIEKQLASVKFLTVRNFTSESEIASSALVELESEGKRQWVFLVPQAGGLAVEVEGCKVQVLATQTPLGGALLGQRAGDIVEVRSGGSTKEVSIVSVQ
jgi:transcription elongation GreA/GreB family factor